MSVHGRARNSFLNSAPLSLSHANDHCCWSSSPYSISPFLSFPSPYFPCRLDQSGPPPSSFYSAGPSPPMLMSYFLRGCPKRQTGEKERREGKRSFPQKKFPPFFSLRASLPPQNFWVNFMQLTASLFSSLLLGLAISCFHILLLRR